METTPPALIIMKVVGSTCALKSKVGGEDMVRCLSDQSLTISKCKIPLLDEQMTVFLQDMNSCYSKLKELVPTLPTNKKASKVEILQHVIDYIWDLQVELDEPEKSRQLSAGSVPRTPLTTLNAELAGITVEVNISSRFPQNKPDNSSVSCRDVCTTLTCFSTSARVRSATNSVRKS